MRFSLRSWESIRQSLFPFAHRSRRSRSKTRAVRYRPQLQGLETRVLLVGDTISAAHTLTFTNGSASHTESIGDESSAELDVDMLKVTLSAGDEVTADIDAQNGADPGLLDSYLRVFDSSGAELAYNDDEHSGNYDSLLSFVADAGGDYFVGVSAFGNSDYDPTIAQSGSPANSTGGYTLTLTLNTSTTTEPDIAVLNDIGLYVEDGTGSVNFGSTTVGTPIDITFRVINEGGDTLTLGAFGPLPSGFSLQAGFGTTSLGVGASTEFTVRLDAAAAGSPEGTLSFGNNDPDENPFNFAISGMVESVTAAPEIIVTRAGVNIMDGGGSDFGDTTVGNPIDVVFTVTNDGDDTLTLGSIALPSGFSLQAGFGTTSLAAEASTQFTVRLDAAVAGSPSGTLSFGNNDSDENPFNFNIQGTVEAAPTLSINDVSTGEGGNAVFTVSLSSAIAADVTFDYGTGDGTAHSDDCGDYYAAIGTLTIPAGQTTQRVTVTTIQDILPEENETFYVNLTNPINASLGDGQGIGTITNDDGDPNNGLQTLAVGSGQNVVSNIDIIDGITGNLHTSFSPFGAFGGGVRVATGDVTGDGVPDIIAGAGPGGGPIVCVFDGVTFAQLAGAIGGFYAYDPSFDGGLFVASGDVNGDGFADVITGADESGGPHVRVFSGVDGSVLQSFFAYPSTFTGGVRVAAGDTAGDSRAEIITSTGPGIETEVAVFDQASVRLNTIIPYPGFGGGAYVSAGDLNVDGHADIVTGAGATGGPHVIAYSGANVNTTLANFFAYPAGFSGGVRPSIGDVTGLGQNHIVTAPGQPGGHDVMAFTNDASIVCGFAPSGGGGVFPAGSPVEPVNQSPMADDDAYSYNVANGEVLSIVAPGVLDGDFDPDGDPLTAAIVAQPAKGAVTLNSDGSFTYTRNADSLGVDSFTYHVSDGTNTSNVATVTIEVKGPLEPQTNDPDQPVNDGAHGGHGGYCPPGFNPQTGGLEVPGPHGYIYRSSDNPHPLVAVETVLSADTANVPTSIEATLVFGGVEGQTVYYDTAGLEPGDPLRFVLQADAGTLAAGRHEYELKVTNHYGARAVEQTFTGTRTIDNLSDSPAGNRWTLKELDRLVPSTGGVTLLRGTGVSLWFTDNGDGSYARPLGEPDFSKLVKNGDGTYTLTTRQGWKSQFNTAGLLTARVDTNGNSVDYAYVDGDSDGQVDDIFQITDPLGRTRMFDYVGGVLSSITDHAGRVTTFEHNPDGTLQSITLPDPDDGGALLAPVMNFSYDPATLLMEQFIDPEGNATDFVHDNALRLAQVVKADGGVDEVDPIQTEGWVDTASGVGTQSNPAPRSAPADVLGRQKHYHHESFFKTDRFGHVTEWTDALGNQFIYERDANGLLTRMIEPDPDEGGPLGPLTTEYNQYDDDGNLLMMTLPDGSTRSWTYEATFGRMTSFTDELGRQTLYTIDPANGNLLSVTYVVGLPDATSSETDDVTTSFSYTDGTTGLPAGLLLTETDPLGRVTAYAYYSDPLNSQFGWVESVTYAQGTLDQATYAFEYDAAGNVTAEIDPLGRRTEHLYDDLDRLIQTTLPDPDDTGLLESPVYHWTYDAAGNVLTETDPLDNVTTYEYDGMNRLWKTTQPDPDGPMGYLKSPVTMLSYHDGHVETITDPLGRVTTFDYDALDRLVKTTLPDPDGDSSLVAPVYVTAYGALGDVLSETDPLRNVTNYAYNLRRWVTSITLPEINDNGQMTRPMTSFGHDKVGNVTSLTDPEGNTTTWAFDDLDRVETETNELNAKRSYVYDKMNNLKRVTDRNGRQIEYDYDNLDRLKQERWVGSYVVMNYAYNAARELTTASDPDSAYSFGYDGIGRVTTIDNFGTPGVPNVVFRQGYDERSLRTSLSATIDGVADFQNAYQYHATAWLKDVQQFGQTGGHAVAEKRIHVVHNAAGQLTSLTRYADVLANTFVATSAFGYDGMGRLTSLRHAKDLGTTVVARYDLGYDAASRITQNISSVDGTSTYGYDATSQLTTADHANQTDENYSFDENGNRTMTGYQTGANNRLLSDGTFNYEYDNEGNEIRRTRISTAYATDYKRLMAWDYRGRLASVAIYDNNSVLMKRIEYAYDVFNRRIEKAIDTTAPFDMLDAAIERYVHDGEHVALIFDGTGALLHRILHNPDVIDHVLAQEDFNPATAGEMPTAPGEVYWPLADNQGTVRDVVDNTGAAVLHAKYGAFGQVVNIDNPTGIAYLFGFTGREYDAETGLHYYRARYYDPNTGRFTSEDPIAFASGTSNLAEYVGNHPTLAADPYGLEEKGFWGRLGNELYWYGQMIIGRRPDGYGKPEPNYRNPWRSMANDHAKIPLNPVAGNHEAIASASEGNYWPAAQEIGINIATSGLGKYCKNPKSILGAADDSGPLINRPGNLRGDQLPAGHYSPHSVSKRMSDRREALGLPRDPDSPIPDLEVGPDGSLRPARPPAPPRPTKPHKPRHGPGERGDDAGPIPPTRR